MSHEPGEVGEPEKGFFLREWPQLKFLYFQILCMNFLQEKCSKYFIIRGGELCLMSRGHGRERPNIPQTARSFATLHLALCLSFCTVSEVLPSLYSPEWQSSGVDCSLRTRLTFITITLSERRNVSCKSDEKGNRPNWLWGFFFSDFGFRQQKPSSVTFQHRRGGRKKKSHKIHYQI